MAYADLGQLHDAWRCIDDAIDKIEKSTEKWVEAEVHRIAGEIALKSLAPDTEKAENYFEDALSVARAPASKVLGTPRRNEPSAPLAQSGKVAAGARTACSDLRLVH